MKKIVIFAGTTEGRKLSERLAEAKIKHTICVATEYGEIVLEQHPLVNVHRGRMNQAEMEQFLMDGEVSVVVDATHPFAKDVTKNLKATVEALNLQGSEISYLRLSRDGIAQGKNVFEENVVFFETHEACAAALAHMRGNILLTTGSKDLSKYCGNDSVRKRLYVRVLPSVESISLCMEQGICGKQIIAMQGPFTCEMNEALFRQYQISCLVTKESGTSGGYPEKLEAARRMGIPVFVIGCAGDEGYSFAEICGKLEEICETRIFERGRLEIVLAGVGMGEANSMTKEVEQAICEADVLFGAKRLLENLRTKAEMKPFYLAEQIIPHLRELQEKKAVVLFSGDSGFYSGCQTLYAALKEEIREGRLCASVRILPGISSVAYLAACIGESYQDAAVYSMHGKTLCNLSHKLKSSPKTFLLTSGVADVRAVGKLLLENGMEECEVITGYQLSYREQRIESHTPAECIALEKEGLYTCFIKNPYPAARRLTHGRKDKDFFREQIPMTKEEVREVSICKLRLHENAVVYDIGSGTGSMAVEIAGLSDAIRVYAVERKAEAVSLIQKNKAKFGLQNITVVEAAAPEGLSGLPMATHAFIGGSGGRLKEILSALRKINPKMRVVVNAVSMETICEIREIVVNYGIEEEEIVQLQVSRGKRREITI